MKIISSLLILLSFSAHSQLMSGNLIDEGRKLITPQNFQLDGNATGEIYFELAVNREGIVTSERLMKEKTSVVSTPTRIRAKELVSQFKFEPGTYYPEFHHVVVKIKVVNPM